MLLLTALDKGQTAAVEASLILTLLMRDDAEPSKFGPQMCSSLLRMGALERLSQLLHPIFEKEDSYKTRCLGKSKTIMCTVR